MVCQILIQSNKINNKSNFDITINFIYSISVLLSMALDKRPLKDVVGKLVVTKEGKRLGLVKDITFEARTGELIQIMLKDATGYAKSLNLEQSTEKDVVVPYNSIIAIGDFVVVSEEDLI